MSTTPLSQTSIRRSLLRDRNRCFLRDFLKNKKCVDCGEKDPVVLEFDHIDPTLKKESISNLVLKEYSLSTIKIEMDKCEIRCANCHRRKTAFTFNWAKNENNRYNPEKHRQFHNRKFQQVNERQLSLFPAV